MSKSKFRIYCLLYILNCILVCSVQAQDKGYLELFGSVTQDGKGMEGADIKVMKGNENSDNALTAGGGKFILNLDLGFSYSVIFSKKGCITKTVAIDTHVPDSEKDQMQSFKFKIELFRLPDGAEMPKDIEKPVAKLGYSNEYAEFDYDVKYAEERKVEVEKVKKDVAALLAKQDADKKAQEERKKRDDETASKAKQQLALAADKAKQDSIAKVQQSAAAATALMEKAQKAKQDSIAAADKRAALEQAAKSTREKATADSLARIASKIKQDSLVAVKEKQRLEQLGLSKARQDSVNTALLKSQKEQAVRAGKEKAAADSIAAIKEKQRQLDAARAVLEKSKQDSIAQVNAKIKRRRIT